MGVGGGLLPNLNNNEYSLCRCIVFVRRESLHIKSYGYKNFEKLEVAIFLFQNHGR